MSKEVKKLNLKESVFEANGKKYTILKEIPMARYVAYKKLVPRLAYGMTFDEIKAHCQRGFAYLNSPKPEPANAAIIFHNIINGILDANNDNRKDPALMICALVIVRDGEDVGKYDEQLCIDKINDWEAEGYEIDAFFHLALVSIKGFRQTFLEFTTQANETIS